MGYAIVNVEDIEGGGPGGVVRFVRREVGVEAFGINWFDLPSGQAGMEHDEAASGQEEVTSSSEDLRNTAVPDRGSG